MLKAEKKINLYFHQKKAPSYFLCYSDACITLMLFFFIFTYFLSLYSSWTINIVVIKILFPSTKNQRKICFLLSWWKLGALPVVPLGLQYCKNETELHC